MPALLREDLRLIRDGIAAQSSPDGKRAQKNAREFRRALGK